MLNEPFDYRGFNYRFEKFKQEWHMCLRASLADDTRSLVHRSPLASPLFYVSTLLLISFLHWIIIPCPLLALLSSAPSWSSNCHQTASGTMNLQCYPFQVLFYSFYFLAYDNCRNYTFSLLDYICFFILFNTVYGWIMYIVCFYNCCNFPLSNLLFVYSK